MNRERMSKIIVLPVLAAAVFVIVLDVFLPTLVILALGIGAMLVTKTGFSRLGFRKFSPSLPLVVLVWAVLWTLADFAVFLPLVSRLTGTVQDMSAFANLKGNTGLLLFLLAASWTLAALGEETVYRGFLQDWIGALIPDEKAGTAAAVLLSSVLFGLAHREQGIVGVAVTTLDALFFSFLKRKYGNLWAPVFAHGFLNTIGIVVFYFTGPIYGLW